MLAELRVSLRCGANRRLPKLMSGELRVKDAEPIVDKIL